MDNSKKRGLRRETLSIVFPYLAAFFLLVLLAVWSSGRSFAQSEAVASWSFDGQLADETGKGNDAYATTPRFVPGRDGSALNVEETGAVVSDAPSLRLAPGLRLECWVKPTAKFAGTQELLVKEQEYMLRIDPASEGGRFSFFVWLEGNWEPRVQSEVAPQVGQWYHLIAGWDGQRLFLDVNGTLAQTPRTGTPRPSHEQLEFGPFKGLIEDVRLENPNAASKATAYWPFESELRDVSGQGHDGKATDASFVVGAAGLALGAMPQPMSVPSSPFLQIAPGFHLDCRVRFEEVPPDQLNIVAKEGEFMLRVDPAQEGSDLAFFVNLDGWEPRVRTNQPIKVGEWYRILADWDGVRLTLEVNGTRKYLTRGGLAHATDGPVTIGGPGMEVDEVLIENPKEPTLRVVHLTQEHAIMRAGIPETITAVVQNLSQEVQGASVSLVVPGAIRCLDNPTQELGALSTGELKTIEWQVVADREISAEALIQVVAPGATPVIARRPLVFFPADDEAAARMAKMDPPSHGGKTYYIDSVAGDNANTGLSEAQPWKDFTRVNGGLLGPGDALLLKRGSVFNQELQVFAKGTADNWAVIGAYGEGPRPIIRRNWDLEERCALVINPDYLRISSLVVCYAGKGLVAHYTEGGHRGLIIEDCIAHHIEGLYRKNANGIPEWLNKNGAPGDWIGSAGFGLSGAPVQDAVLRDSEMFQTSNGFFVQGDGVVVDRVYCHDNYVHNTSPHPFLVNIRRSYLQNSVFDASGWHASAGTMGIMLGDPQGLIIRNCTWRNQPDSGSHDEGGIDFENSGNGCLIDHCTFQNNSGAAIEVLGLSSPQTRNVEIAGSRFFANNTALKLGPGEIFIWGKGASPDIACSTGVVHDNGYVLLPGVEFFVNEAPDTTHWTLWDNTQYATIAEADRAMPFNGPPEVDAGPDLHSAATTVHLAGSINDDGRSGDPLTARWEVLEGPGAIVFGEATSPQTTATFSEPGDYVLRLVADDGELWLSDMTTVHILPAGASVAKAWEFNVPLDKEGWSEADLGTQRREWANQDWPTVAEPVKYVGGGYYIVAIENSADARLVSADNLDEDLSDNKTITLCIQNHTPATRMRFSFTTEANPDWQEANSKSFEVVPEDTSPRVYKVDMSDVPGWTGRLKQLRLDLADGTSLTGTVRIDYLWIGTR